MALPPPAEQRAIGEMLSALDEKVAVHKQIVDSTLMLQRELLLLLMSGRAYEGRLSSP